MDISSIFLDTCVILDRRFSRDTGKITRIEEFLEQMNSNVEDLIQSVEWMRL